MFGKVGIVCTLVLLAAAAGVATIEGKPKPVSETLERGCLLERVGEEQAIELFSVSAALFVENQGQWEEQSIRYAFQGSGANVLFTDTGPIFQVFRREPIEDGEAADDLTGLDALMRDPLRDEQDYITQMAQFSVQFDGAHVVPPTGLDQGETRFNYFIGDQANWRSNVPTYETVAYLGLYDGIDLHTWGRRDSLKYEFHVAPGTDWSQIEVSYEGIEGLYLDETGALHVQTELGELIDDAPYIYQEIAGERVEVAGSFELIDSDTYAFNITGACDASRELIIDPELAWSTYVGGSSSDYGYDIAVDDAGNVLVTGYTFSSGWTSGGFDTTHNGGSDAFVAKLSPSGGHVWSTYLGGSDSDYGYGIAVDSAGNVLATGRTWSPGWTNGGFDTSFNGAWDAFVVQIYDGPIVARYVFYNNSAWDGNDPAANASDDGAIDPSKSALLPGEMATFANYTSYSLGINGIMVDILDTPGTPTAGDFDIHVSYENAGSHPSHYIPGPSPTSVTVRSGEGVAGSDRVTLIFGDTDLYNSRWMRITVKATATTGLASDDVFYYGLAIGETGNSASDTYVNASDRLRVRANPHSGFDPAPVNDAYDVNRDKFVNASDRLIMRSHVTTGFDCLTLITLPY